MQHIEFIHRDHFEQHYHRKKPKQSLSKFIDFFWEIHFEDLWEKYPEGFSDVLFANIGYTYLINLGTPFVMKLDDEAFDMRSDGFLPRHTRIECQHSAGNKMFGIKFKVSPIILQKKINFSEYKQYIFPLAYLLERKVIDEIKEVNSFTARVEIISAYYDQMIDAHSETIYNVEVVTKILEDCYNQNDFSVSIEELSQRYKVSSRTLQRYFEAATSISSKQALQIMRIRKAVEEFIEAPAAFDYRKYDYYDNSHFYKHLKKFLGSKYLKTFQQTYNPIAATQ